MGGSRRRRVRYHGSSHTVAHPAAGCWVQQRRSPSVLADAVWYQQTDRRRPSTVVSPPEYPSRGTGILLRPRLNQLLHASSGCRRWPH
eukprot:1145625-Prymnesium_polylepis.1